MAKSKTQADPGKSRIAASPPSAPALDRKKSKGNQGGRRMPMIAKKDVGSGGRKALH